MTKFQKIAILALCATTFFACGEKDVRETTHYNGIRKTQVPYRDGKPDGEFKRWTSHGDLAESGLYQNGTREGEWTEWFSNGKVQARGLYKKGKKDGSWKEYFFDGSLAAEKTFLNGEPVGIWKTFHENGSLREKNSCFKGNANGTREVFAANGKRISAETCKSGVLDGRRETFYPGGPVETRSEYQNGKLHGKSELFRASGELWKRAFYRNGVRDSVWTYFKKDGSIERQSLFQNGNGIAYGELGENGIDAETTFVDNRISDTLRYRVPGHRLLYMEIWENGEKKKLLSFYDSLGTHASEGFFRNGKIDGCWRNWFSDGKLKDSLFYKDGEPFGEQLHYDSTGRLYMRKNRYGKNGPMKVGFE